MKIIETLGWTGVVFIGIWVAIYVLWFALIVWYSLGDWMEKKRNKP